MDKNTYRNSIFVCVCVCVCVCVPQKQVKASQLY